MNKKRKTQLIIVVSEIVMIIILGAVLCAILMGLVKKFSDSISSTSKEKVHIVQDETTTKESKQLYVITPGYTYYVDKGAMKLYADIIPMSTEKIFIIGKEFHNDNEMDDAFIKEAFVKQEDGTYANADNTMIVNYYDTTATFKDKRPVALQFSGTLNLVLEDENVEDNVSEEYVNNIVTEIQEEVSVEGVVVDEYSTESTPSNFVSVNLYNYLTPDYEKSEMVITAKYIESATNSGTKYQDIYTGTYFYAFGSEFPYESSTCNTVTITGIYRGNEQHFNGLEMDGKYPCFVISNIRKPNKNEVSQKITH